MTAMTTDHILAHWDEMRLLDWYVLEEMKDFTVTTVMLGSIEDAEREMVNMATNPDMTCREEFMVPFYRIRLLGMDEAWHKFRQAAGLEDYGVTHRQAAFAIGCSVQWVYKLLESGKLALTDDGLISHVSVDEYRFMPKSKGGRPRKND